MASVSAGQDIRETNRRRLIEYWLEGCHAEGDRGLLGLEVEHQVLTDDGRPVYYSPRDGVVGVEQILEALRVALPQQVLGADGDLIGFDGPSFSVSLEPAGQIEVSVAPHTDVARVMAGYDAFRSSVDPVLAAHGARLVAAGYDPAVHAAEAELIPKRRYEFMSEYFRSIGTHAERMMRATASTQVSIDYRSEADAVRKLRVGVALTPVLAAIMDNTRVFELEPNHLPLRRLSIWRDVDDARCGIQPGLFSPGYGFGQMADWVLSTPPIFVTRPPAGDPTGPALRYTGSLPAYAAYGDAPMDEHDVEHLLSMFWPHVRLKHVIEVRPADSAPRDVVGGYVALLKGLFYSEASLAAVEEAIGVRGGVWPIDAADVEAAIDSVQASGMGGDVYGRSLGHWERELFSLARASLPAPEAARLSALERFAAEKDWWRLS